MNSKPLRWKNGKTEYYFESIPKLYTMAKFTINGNDKYALYRRDDLLAVYTTPDEASEAAQEDTDNIPM
jgi:hypothetical protein